MIIAKVEKGSVSAYIIFRCKRLGVQSILDSMYHNTTSLLIESILISYQRILH